MYFRVIFAFILLLSVMISACSEKTSEVSKRQQVAGAEVRMHPEVKAVDGEEKKGLAEAIKKKTLPGYPAKTIGKAIEGYSFFTKGEWRETQLGNGKVYIDYAGWFDTKRLDIKNIQNGIAAKGIELKFVITPDGPFFLGMVSRLEAKTSGKVDAYPLEDVKSVLDSIYANKEISF